MNKKGRFITVFSIEDITAYQIASELSDYIWDIVIKWPYFAKKTLGIQFVSSIDSIASNIAEGHGRHFKKDKVRFFYIARGSLIEATHWTEKAYKRKLISKQEYNHIKKVLDKLPIEINYLIKLTMEKLNK